MISIFFIINKSRVRGDFPAAKEGGGKRCVVCVSVYVCVLSSKVRRRVPWPWRSTHHE